MIIKKHCFGIMLTTPYGDAIYHDLVALIYEKHNCYLPKWVVSLTTPDKCNSGDQLLLGFEIIATKDTDYKAAEEKWHKIISDLPDDIKNIVEINGLKNPDIEILVGMN